MVAGVGRKPQIIVITIATFLIMTVTIYQGVINVDETLIKAARVIRATDKDIFLKVICTGDPAIYHHCDPFRKFHRINHADRRRIHRRTGWSWYENPFLKQQL